MLTHSMFCESYEARPEHGTTGSYLLLPNTVDKELDVLQLAWSTHTLPDGRSIGIGRNLNGIVAIHIPAADDQ